LPFRKCIGCANVKNRVEMVRIMKLYDTGEIIINPTSRHFGRSYYVCCNIECVNKILKKKKIHKILKREVPAEIIEYLEKIGK